METVINGGKIRAHNRARATALLVREYMLPLWSIGKNKFTDNL
jgi:hypothetical protein